MKPKIEDIEVDDMDQLNKELRLKSDKQRHRIIRKYAGGYCRCYGIPSKKVSYDIGGAKLVEFYCDNCFKYMKEGRSKQVMGRFLETGE